MLSPSQMTHYGMPGYPGGRKGRALVAQDDEEVGDNATELEPPAAAVEAEGRGGCPGPPGLARHNQPRPGRHAPAAAALPRAQGTILRYSSLEV